MFGTVPQDTADSVQSSYTVDGVWTKSYSSLVGARPAPDYQQVFFSFDELDFGWHVIAATVESAGKDFSYWFDFLTYEMPPPAIPLAAGGKKSIPAARIVVPSVVLPVIFVLVLVWRFWRRKWPFCPRVYSVNVRSCTSASVAR